MPKLKVTDDELDVEELEDAEYNEDGDFEDYSGEQPPKGTILRGFIKKMWWTYSQNDNPMLKILFVADGNTGDLEEYNGLPVWENAVLIPSVKFRWQPFLDTFGLTIRDVKTKLYVSADDDNQGAPIEKIGKWEPGEDARCRIVTKRERYQGEWNTKVSKWLDDEEAADEEEEEEAPPPRRSRAAKPAASSRRKPDPEPEEDEEEEEAEEAEDEEEEEEAPPPRRGPAGRSRTSTARAKAPAKAPARGRSRRAAAQDVDDEEPPF